jgi:hypothetical protein
MCQLRVGRESERDSRRKKVDRATINNKHSNNIQISLRTNLRFYRRVRKFEKRDSFTNGEFAGNMTFKIFFNLSMKFKFCSHMTRVTGTVHEERCTLMTMSS